MAKDPILNALEALRSELVYLEHAIETMQKIAEERRRRGDPSKHSPDDATGKESPGSKSAGRRGNS